MALIQTRLTFFGLNPNDVATFIVVLILSLPVVIRWSQKWSWFVLPTEGVLIAALVGTGSRGGVLALICGLMTSIVVLGGRSSQFRNWKIWVAVGMVLVLGVSAGLVAFPKASRLVAFDISPEASAGRRLEVWSMVPAMIASAPNGWGLGNAAEGYEEWFEPVGEPVQLKHLLSSHLTWLVEFGWPLRWLYLLLWIGAITILLPDRKFVFPTWGVAVWTALFVALFYNAAGKWWNWPLPVVWLVIALILRCKATNFPSRRHLIQLVAGTGILAGLPLIFSLSGFGPSIHVSDGGNIVLIGSGKPTIAVLGPSRDVLGNFYGQDIRSRWSKAERQTGSVVVVTRPDPDVSRYLTNCHLYIISGGDETTLYKWRMIFTPRFESKLLLINCRARPDDWIKVFRQVVYYRGTFYGDPYYNEWRALSATHPAVCIKDVPRAGAYISDWWSLADVASE